MNLQLPYNTVIKVGSILGVVEGFNYVTNNHKIYCGSNPLREAKLTDMQVISVIYQNTSLLSYQVYNEVKQYLTNVPTYNLLHIGGVDNRYTINQVID